MSANGFSPIVIGGALRSGAGLVGDILNRHESIHIYEGTNLLTSSVQFYKSYHAANHEKLRAYGIDEKALTAIVASMGGAMFLGAMADYGVSRAGEVSADNCQRFCQIADLFPDARFIHVFRDGRDVVASLLRQEWRGDDGQKMAICADIHAACEYWLHNIKMANALKCYAREAHYAVVQYEELIAQPTHTIHRLCKFIGEPPDKACKNYLIVDEFIGQWKQQLTEEEKQICRERIGGMLIELGYEADRSW